MNNDIKNDIKYKLKYTTLNRNNIFKSMYDAHIKHPEISLKYLPSYMVANMEYSFIGVSSHLIQKNLDKIKSIKDKQDIYLVYILKCDNLTYVGMTNDFFRRWQQHNQILSGGAKYTKKGCEWYPICIIDGFMTMSEAMQCEWKLKSRRSKLSRKFKGAIGRIEYLNILLKNERWTSNSPKIKEQNLKIYIDDDYKTYLEYDTRELYFK